MSAGEASLPAIISNSPRRQMMLFASHSITHKQAVALRRTQRGISCLLSRRAGAVPRTMKLERLSLVYNIITLHLSGEDVLCVTIELFNWKWKLVKCGNLYCLKWGEVSAVLVKKGQGTLKSIMLGDRSLLHVLLPLAATESTKIQSNIQIVLQNPNGQCRKNIKEVIILLPLANMRTT